MKKRTIVFSAFMMSASLSFGAFAAPKAKDTAKKAESARVEIQKPTTTVAEVGQTAPDFEVKDANGVKQKLSDQKGKWVVLEWFNKDCPYVKKHYGTQNMQDLQKKYRAKGVVWFSVISSAPGKQGHVSAAQALADAKERMADPTAILLDESGEVGQKYGAKTTPHMFVINPAQNVVYAGAIDNNDSSDAVTARSAKNFVAAALDEGMSGKTITTASSRPYGCSVKYK